jgi:hypothetical protein
VWPQVAGLVAQVARMEAHQKRVIELPLAVVVASAAAPAKRSPRRSGSPGPAKPLPPPAPAPQGAAGESQRSGRPPQEVLLTPRCGAGAADGAEPAGGDGQGVLLPVEAAQKLAGAAVAEATAAAAELAELDGASDVLQRQASAMVAAVAGKLARRLAEFTSGGADGATGWVDERVEGLVREATNALRSLREQQRQLLAGRCGRQPSSALLGGEGPPA